MSGSKHRTNPSCLGRLLLRRGLTLATAESCTGGMVGSLITDEPGSSRYFLGGVVAYSNEAKVRLLGVKPATLKRYGAVSSQTAAEMAEGVRKRLGADLGVAVTGIAGPGGGTKKKPVGLVFIAVAAGRKYGKCPAFSGSRREVRKQAAEAALALVAEALKAEFKAGEPWSTG